MMHTLSIDTTARLVTPPTPEAAEETGYAETDDGILSMTDERSDREGRSLERAGIAAGLRIMVLLHLPPAGRQYQRKQQRW